MSMFTIYRGFRSLRRFTFLMRILVLVLLGGIGAQALHADDFASALNTHVSQSEGTGLEDFSVAWDENMLGDDNSHVSKLEYALSYATKEEREAEAKRTEERVMYYYDEVDAWFNDPYRTVRIEGGEANLFGAAYQIYAMDHPRVDMSELYEAIRVIDWSSETVQWLVHVQKEEEMVESEPIFKGAPMMPYDYGEGTYPGNDLRGVFSISPLFTLGMDGFNHKYIGAGVTLDYRPHYAQHARKGVESKPARNTFLLGVDAAYGFGPAAGEIQTTLRFGLSNALVLEDKLWYEDSDKLAYSNFFQMEYTLAARYNWTTKTLSIPAEIGFAWNLVFGNDQSSRSLHMGARVAVNMMDYNVETEELKWISFAPSLTGFIGIMF